MKKIIFIIIAFNLFLISCSKVRDSAGVNRKVINEYNVIERPPLVIPPNFNLLPPEQILSKDIDETDSDLAKEILFGLDENDNEPNTNNSLITEIIKETNANSVDNSIRDDINEEFAGEKSTLQDEKKFKNEDELNAAIEETKKKDGNNQLKKEKKKKRFFFF